MIKPATVDFETKAIRNRPAYPPTPVSVSIKRWRRKPVFSAWGHPSENNCSKNEAVTRLREAWNDPTLPLLFHNSKFDYDVATTKLGLKKLPWERIHDTQYLLFLRDPYARSISLKPAAAELLGMPPEESDAVKQWLLKHDPEAIADKPSAVGAYIANAPGRLVGKYADGDVIRTEGLFGKIYPEIVERGMLPAYNRERQIMPIMLENERKGVRVDLPALERDIPIYEAALIKADNWLRKRVGVPGLNIDADEQWGNALDAAGIVTDWKYTAKSGKRSVSKVNLTLDMYNDPRVASVYGYRNRLATGLRMFMIPWRDTARETGGTVHTTWNQVRAARGDKNTDGTRSGRFSSTNPNLANISKSFEDRGDGYVYPKWLRVPPLPLCRVYMLPDKGEVWLHRDWNQQELRLLAHYEDGELLQAYLRDPNYSVHRTVHGGLEKLLAREFYYTYVKNFDFQVVYGGGLPAVCGALKCDQATGKKAIAALKELLPGYDALKSELISMGKRGEPVITWGGREYYTEPPAYSKKHNRHMTFEYKLLSYLIQGSAGDCIKEAIIRLHNHPKFRSRLLTTVYDELNLSVHPKLLKEQNAVLTEVMLSIELDLPLISEGKVGPSWGNLTKLAA